MRDKILYVLVGVLFFGVLVMMTINGQQRAKIQSVQQKMKQLDKKQLKTDKSIDKLETNYNALDEQAKSKLLQFAKGYYTFSNQAQYTSRYDKVKETIALSDEQQASLFDNGLDDTGGSKIENLGLASRYETAVGYTSDKQDDVIETYATVVIKASSSANQAIRQTVLIHGWYDIKQGKFVSIKINDVQ